MTYERGMKELPRGEFSRLVMRCVKWDGYITRFLGMLGLESLCMKEER
jgi:hypothetical protein